MASNVTNPDTAVTTDLVRLLLLNAADIAGMRKLTNEYSLKVSDNTLSVLIQIVGYCPELFIAIQSDLQAIFADGQLNLNDIPSLILMCVDIYDAHLFKKISGLSGTVIIETIKVIVLLLINTGIIQIKDNATKASIIAEINISALLLERTVGNKVVSKCFSCFGCCKSSTVVPPVVQPPSQPVQPVQPPQPVQPVPTPEAPVTVATTPAQLVVEPRDEAAVGTGLQAQDSVTEPDAVQIEPVVI